MQDPYESRTLDVRRIVIQVARSPLGWWDVRSHDGRVQARYVSEFQAWEAGRALAEQSGADLMLRPESGPVKYELYDAATRTVRPADEEQPQSVAAAGRHLVLVVEDALDARELYAEYLSYAGFSVVTAANAHEAVRLARLRRPDLIVMDIRLPGMDGLEAIEELKRDPALSNVPMVALTSDSSDDMDARVREAGCRAFITKPALPQDVATCITRLLKGHGSQAVTL